MLDGLRAAGVLLDVDAADLLAADAGPAAAARTAAELPTALAGAAGPVWRRRRAAVVVVEGANRVGVPLAAMLAASGVGRVSVRDTGLVTAGDAIVGGLTAADEGRPRALAAADAIRRASPLTDLRPPPAEAVDLVVLAAPWAASDPLAAAAIDASVPHLRRHRPRGGRRRRSAGGARGDELSAVRRPAPPGRRPAMAPSRRAAHRRRTPAEWRHRHLPADRRDRRDAGPRLSRRGRGACHARRDRGAAPTGPPAPHPEVAPAPRLRLRSGRREDSAETRATSRARTAPFL